MILLKNSNLKIRKKMNVFEDLIEELKEENLLEETVVEKNSKTVEDKFDAVSEAAASEDLNFEDNCVEPAAGGESSFHNYSETDGKPSEQEFSIESAQNNSFDENPGKVELNLDGKSAKEAETGAFNSEEPKKNRKIVNQAEFFRNRAASEVTSLQLVENVLAGVEREILNVVPKLYDELPVKKALHNFLQVSANINTPEHAQAEFQLMQETESWYSALTRRDKNVSVGNLRLFCENSRPALSSQALISLARFYRNAPYSESIRSKFDLILTRLFSRETVKGKRSLSLNHDKLVEKISALYAEWSSVPLYSTEEDDSRIVLAALKLEDFITEAENADSFEELVKNDFFNRLRVFKESTQESFFAPLLAAAVVESNVRIGNCYVELFAKEKENNNTAALEEKYGSLHEQTISEVVCKTLAVKEAVVENPVKPVHTVPKKAVPAPSEPAKNEDQPAKAVEKKQKSKNKFFKVNKWLLALTIITLLGTLGLYMWVASISGDEKLPDNVKNVNLENSSLKEFIQTARISEETFYGIVLPSWDGLSREKKEEFLKKLLQIGSEKNFIRVNLLDRKGKTVGYASPEKVEVGNP